MNSQPVFRPANAALSAAFAAAQNGLRGNLRELPGCARPVLIEGTDYGGIWLECGPHEALIAAQVGALEVQTALDAHSIFAAHQSDDGFLPPFVWHNKIGAAHVQSVVPFACTALESWKLSGDAEFLRAAYNAAARYDQWLANFRDTRGSGAREIFCEYDTGHDRSPRLHGLLRECPANNARLCPPDTPAPLIAPDLTAMVFGARQALSQMASILGRDDEALQWRENAETTRRALLKHCFDAQDICFYDLDGDGSFVRVRGDALLRVLGEGVPDAALFDQIYTRHLRDPQGFWTPFPHPSIAAADPAFGRTMPFNSWGGPAQALAALRAPRWMELYNRRADCAHLMRRWIESITRAGGFFQQINPWTGEALGGKGAYSPAMLVLLDFCARLHGVREIVSRDKIGGAPNSVLEWGCELPEHCRSSEFSRLTPGGQATLQIDETRATLRLDEVIIAEARGVCRVVTAQNGLLREVVGVAATTQKVWLSGPQGSWEFTLQPDELWRVPAAS